MTKEKIKEIAISHFADKGYEGATLAAIAKEVGIKTPSIYAFFSSKEDLFLTVFANVLEDHFLHIKRITNNLTSEGTEEKLFGILEEVFHYHSSHEANTKFLKRAMLFPPHSLRESLHDTFLQEEDLLSIVLSEIFEQGIKEGTILPQKIEDLLAAYFCLMDGVFLQISYYNPSEFQSRLKSIWKIFWSGLARQQMRREE